MKFSARVSYGIRAAIVLAENYGQGPVLGKDISEREDLPPAYLEQIMSSLRRADLVTGTRGARGGYVLARSPESVTATDLITALEGPVQLSECPDGPSCCGHPEQCVVSELYAAAEAALHGVFDGVTLANMVERRRSLRSGSSMYHI